MPNWIRVVFLQYLPTMLMMKRPKKTRLRWMMDLPGVYHQHYHPSHPLPAAREWELLDVHHPNCTVARALSGSISSESNTLVLSSEGIQGDGGSGVHSRAPQERRRIHTGEAHF
ncbi:hypothetical protein CEXT_795601 [Caerostris extrusa]|uniref:Uncharacterized protein n=1 Tax=Caerostris extrusa TaxID=172846 RepID=A0AAV4N0L1_CAEEX|nr:hypothetical protein CEXT_795601 [Caerostris extrusa]